MVTEKDLEELFERESVPRLNRAFRPFLIGFVVLGVLAGAGLVWAAEGAKEVVLSLATGVVAGTFVAFWFRMLDLALGSVKRKESQRLLAIVQDRIRDEEE